jgi:hypothetical protein
VLFAIRRLHTQAAAPQRVELTAARDQHHVAAR